MDNIFKGTRAGDTETAEETIINSNNFIDPTPGRFKHNILKNSLNRQQASDSFDNIIEKRNKHS